MAEPERRDDILDQSVRDFLAATAAKSPTPGGGSVAALAGALAAAMGEMVVNYSLGKKSLAAFEPQLRPVLEALNRARALMLDLMVEDQSAFESLRAAKKLPAGAEREKAIKLAVDNCIRVPQSISATAVVVLRLSESIVDIANVFLLSDLAVCGDLAMAAARCAQYNVRVNLAEVQDAQERIKIETATNAVFSHALELIQRLSPRIWRRISKGPEE